MLISLGDRPWQNAKPDECAASIEKWKKQDDYVLYTNRRSYVRLRLEDEDVLALFYALLERKERDGAVPTLILFAELLSRLSATCKKAAEVEKLGQDKREERLAARQARVAVARVFP